MEKEITYSKAVERLNEIMQQMENGALDVDALTETLREARQLLQFCKDKLRSVDKNIQEITSAVQQED